MRLMAATVMSTANLIALSAHASDWADCICSAISCMRRWKSGSLKKLLKPSMTPILLGGGAGQRAPRRAGTAQGRAAGVLGGPAADGAPQRGEGERAGEDRQPEREHAVGEHGDQREGGVDAEGHERADHP